MTHVRSYSTETQVGNSRAELERTLTRYGCSRFGSDVDRAAGVVTVWFTVPDSQADKAPSIPVRLEVRLANVQARLYTLWAKDKQRKGAPTPEQVERVAWRHIVFLVQAGLEAAAVGVKPISEFFLADTIVPNAQGVPVRFVTALEAREPEWRKRLGPGTTGG